MSAENQIQKIESTPEPADDALKLSLVQQALIFPFAGLILDGGGIFLVVLFALIAYWCGVLLVRLHRQGCYTKFDLILFRWGFFALCFISFFLARWIWTLRGYEA